MTGFSFVGALAMVAALFAILFIAPAGVKKTSDQVISAQVIYGGGFLALFAGLVTVLMYIWLYSHGVLKDCVPELFMSFWSAFQSSVFGAVYWVFLCSFFVQNKKTTAGKMCLIGWLVLMWLLNYLPELYGIGVASDEKLALGDIVTDSIATVLIVIALTTLSYLYFKHRYRWTEL